MTKKLSRPPMELDLDAFLQSHTTSSDDDENLHPVPRRTVDEIILNNSDSDSDSSVSSPSHSYPSHERRRISSSNQSLSSPKEQRSSEVSISNSPKETVISSNSYSSVSNFGPISRLKSRDSSGDLSLLVPNVSTPLPPLFGAVRSSAKPGDALAAAAAASRSFPTPHAAAIKSRRASSRNREDLGSKDGACDSEVVSESGGADLEGFRVSNDVHNRISSETSQPNEKLVGDYLASSDDLRCTSPQGEVYTGEEIQGDSLSEVKPLKAALTGVVHEIQVDQSNDCSLQDVALGYRSIYPNSGDENNLVEKHTLSNSSHGSYKHSVPIAEDDKNDVNYAVFAAIEDEENNINYAGVTAAEDEKSNVDSAVATAAKLTQKDSPSPPLLSDHRNTEEKLIDVVKEIQDQGDSFPGLKDGELSNFGNDSSLDFKEDDGVHSESRTENKLHCSFKPLDLAEELEKKHAFTGLHLEEGAAAQPMRLEGVTKGSTVLGYFDVDANNIITRTISSQAFRRDHGYPQVVAVHLNFIAVGMSRGLILVVPCKYYPYRPDNMDAKFMMLGLQGDRSHAPVTSMCFSPQGDLLFSGYGDGHITVWDVLKASIVKVINEHRAPVVHLLYLGQDSQVTRQFDILSGDSKGVVKSLRFSVVPWINMISFSKSTPLLDGQTTSTVICAAVLLSDEYYGGPLMSSRGSATVSSSGLGSMMGGVVGGDAGRKLFEGYSLAEEGVCIFVTHQSALVAKVIVPDVKVYAQLPKPEGVQDGSMPYAAWKCMAPLQGNPHLEASERVSLLGIAWDRTVQVAKLVKSELKVCWKWTLECSAVGISWLNDQMLVILTTTGQICLFERDGTAIHQTSFSVDGPQGDELVAYHTHFSSNLGNTEKAFHNSLAARGASIYILGPMRLVVSRLLPWKEQIEVLRKAGDWMGALNMAMTLFDGQAHGVIDLPGTLEDIQKAVMPYLVELLLSYVDEVFSYISVAFGTQIEKLEPIDDSESSICVHSEIKEQFTRVGGVAVEFCVHIKRTDILFDEILSRFISVKQKESFFELLEPYILKDMLGSLPPEIMQALVEHYSSKGWLQRVEQCVLHMDISSLDFNQVVRLCREHRLYGALIYLFNKGLDDFRTPLEELLLVLRSSPRESATSLGYRMLVYLKYCFGGLAFPPGHGTLPPTRLTSLRKELVEFLMEDSGSSNLVVDTSLSTTTIYPNLYHLLEFDTQAALDVLRCAFVEDETSISDYSLHGPSISNAEITGINDMVLESQNLVQDIVLVLSRILDIGHLQVDMSTSRIDSRATDIWPSNTDLCYVFEFISYYVACGRAYVSREILSQILEYLMSETNFISSSLWQNFSTSKIKEKQVLALLEVVPEKDWDASSLLHMCEKAQFHLVCGFVHAIRHQYVAALDNYMKDMDEPIHAFFFIDQMLAKLSGNELDDFQSAVISRIPSLIKLSRAGAFFLLSDRFDSNTQEIFSQLHSSPESHFLYLKTVFEVHSTGALDVSCLRKVNIIDFPSGRRASDQSDRFRAYLDRIYNFPKFLRNNPIHLTDETIELYLELLCRYERKSVLKFLETFESYRVEQCLGLCQDYGIVDATAFLLERVGDAGSALSLTLSDLDDKFVMLDASVRNVIADIGGAYLDALLRMEEVIEIFNIVHSCIGLCQRNSPRLDPDESESLWFQLLDSFCDPLMDSCNDSTVSEGEKQMESVSESFGKQEDDEECKIKWKVSKSHEGAHILRKLFPVFIKEIVEGMIGYVCLPTIMSKLLSDNGSQEFGDFKLTILGMLGTYDFEKRILDTAKSLIEDNTFYTMSLLKRGASHGYAPRGHLCCVCSCPLTKDSSNSNIRIFSCGHATHPRCEMQDNGLSPNNSSAGCPICIPKNIQRTKSKSVITGNGLVNRSSLGLQQSLDSIATHPHEIDAFDNSYGLPSISRFELLTNLQKDQRSIHIESIPQLRLAPPAVYHEKVKKRNDLLIGESSSSVPKVEKTSKRLRDIKVKGSSIRFPLKSNIFGKEKTVKQ